MKKLQRGGARRVGSTSVPRVSPAKGWLLYVLSAPLLPATLFGALSGNSRLAVGGAIGFALAMGAATLMRKGLGIENEALRRKIVRRRSTVPYKALGAGLIGVAMFVVEYFAVDGPLLASVVMGLAASAGALLTYGLDPSRSAPDMPAIGVTAEEVIEVLDEADAKVAAIESAAGKITNIELKNRLRGITAGVREIMDVIEDDPRDLGRARKFLKVYLDGAQRVTEGYASTHRDNQSGELEENFRNVLDTIETVISEQKVKLHQNNLTELDVQIEVLQLQLEKEGV